MRPEIPPAPSQKPGRSYNIGKTDFRKYRKNGTNKFAFCFNIYKFVKIRFYPAADDKEPSAP